MRALRILTAIGILVIMLGMASRQALAADICFQDDGILICPGRPITIIVD